MTKYFAAIKRLFVNAHLVGMSENIQYSKYQYEFWKFFWSKDWFLWPQNLMKKITTCKGSGKIPCTHYIILTITIRLLIFYNFYHWYLIISTIYICKTEYWGIEIKKLAIFVISQYKESGPQYANKSF